jgi:hypothetical protein
MMKCRQVASASGSAIPRLRQALVTQNARSPRGEVGGGIEIQQVSSIRARGTWRVRRHFRGGFE